MAFHWGPGRGPLSSNFAARGEIYDPRPPRRSPRAVRRARRNIKWIPAGAAAAARRRAPGRRGGCSRGSALSRGAHARADRRGARATPSRLSLRSRNCQAERAGGYWLRDTPRLLPESGSLYFGRISLNSVTELREGGKFPAPARRREARRGEGSPTFSAAACAWLPSSLPSWRQTDPLG